VIAVERKFRVLRIIGTLWKVLAWIELMSGILVAVAILLFGILGQGGFVLRLFGQETVVPVPIGVVSGVAGFILMLASTIVSFLVLYALGDLIFVLLAIEENTRRTMHSLEHDWSAEAERPTPPPPSP
jgi:hypothetical protein